MLAGCAAVLRRMREGRADADELPALLARHEEAAALLGAAQTLCRRDPWLRAMLPGPAPPPPGPAAAEGREGAGTASTGAGPLERPREASWVHVRSLEAVRSRCVGRRGDAAGCAGLCGAVRGCAGLCGAVRGCEGLCGAVRGCAGL